jgi:hypothetical protein
MSIQDLIAEKWNQVNILKRHIKMLEQMAREEGDRGATRRNTARLGKARERRDGRRGSSSRAGMVEAYLRAHPGAQPAREMAAALGLKPTQLHGAIHSGLKTGRFVRGKGRATFALGSGGAVAARGRKAKGIDRGGRATRRRSKLSVPPAAPSA